MTLSFALPADGKVNFSIFDVLGHEVYHNGSLDSHPMGTGFTMNESEILLPNLESGIYYARLTSGNVVATQKLEIKK